MVGVFDSAEGSVNRFNDALPEDDERRRWRYARGAQLTRMEKRLADPQEPLELDEILARRKFTEDEESDE